LKPLTRISLARLLGLNLQRDSVWANTSQHTIAGSCARRELRSHA